MGPLGPLGPLGLGRGPSLSGAGHWSFGVLQYVVIASIAC